MSVGSVTVAASLHPPLQPRRGNVLRVMGVARISTLSQDEKSLADQEALYRRWLDQNYGEPYELEMIATQGSGERIDREELTTLGAAIESRTLDLVLAEDLARIARRIHAVLICEACEDADTRLIAINDSIDTAREDWRLSSFFATFRHESYNRDTGRRIRRSQRNRFIQGGVLKPPPFCYSKSPGAKHDSEIQIIPDMVPIVEELFRRLEGGANFSELADWLNAENVPVGPDARRPRWSRGLLRSLVFNPILKGVRERNRKVSVRVNATGRRKSIDASPGELLSREVPHLTIIAADRYDRVIAMVRSRNAKYSVGRALAVDSRKHRPKKRTRWPGQSVACGICGRALVYGGNGQKEHLICNGARSYECWNGITFDGALGAARMSEAVFKVLAGLPEFDDLLLDSLREEAAHRAANRGIERLRLQRQSDQLQHQISNLLSALRDFGPSPTLLTDLRRLEREQAEARDALAAVAADPATSVALPSVEVIRAKAQDEFGKLAADSSEFARYMQQIVPRIVAYPVRLCDGGHVGLRATLDLSLTGFVPASWRTPMVESHLTNCLVFDLFEMPQRAAFRERVVQMHSRGMLNETIAKELDLTLPAVVRAKGLQRLMDSRGLTDPYLRLESPPDDYKKMRRHLHPRYRFNPMGSNAAA